MVTYAVGLPAKLLNYNPNYNNPNYNLAIFNYIRVKILLFV